MTHSGLTVEHWKPQRCKPRSFATRAHTKAGTRYARCKLQPSHHPPPHVATERLAVVATLLSCLPCKGRNCSAPVECDRERSCWTPGMKPALPACGKCQTSMLQHDMRVRLRSPPATCDRTAKLNQQIQPRAAACVPTSILRRSGPF